MKQKTVVFLLKGLLFLTQKMQEMYCSVFFIGLSE